MSAPLVAPGGGPFPFPRDSVDGWLDRALRAADGVEGVEAHFSGHASSLLRLAESRVVQAGHVAEGELTVRIVAAGREAWASTHDLTGTGIQACVAAAMTTARWAPAPDQPFELPVPTGAPREVPDAWDGSTARLDASTKERWLAPSLQAHRTDDLALAGRFHSGTRVRAVRSSTGVRAWHAGSYVDLALSSLERPAGHRASSYRTRSDARVGEALVQGLAEETRQECHRAHDPIDLDPGAWDVVLAPAAVADLLGWLAQTGFSSKAYEDGQSFVEGKVGEPVTGAQVTLIDDGTMPHRIGVPMPFDAEGQPRQRVTLVEHGVARSIVHDTRSARRAGTCTTGHARGVDLFTTGGSEAAHLHFEPGEAELDELVGQVDVGLLVTRLHYVNGLIDPRRAVMTGLLRDAAFLIEDGRPTRAVRSLRFTDSILEAFARIPGARGVGRQLESVGSWEPGHSTVCPHLLVRGLRFTSGRR
jgi:predicted Zn-dependent protease